MRSVILSQWRERRMGVMWQVLVALTTARATLTFSAFLKPGWSLPPPRLNSLTALPPNYSLLSVPQNSTGSSNGGSTGNLICKPFTQLPACTSVTYLSFFESSCITLQLSHSKLSVYNIYRPPSSSAFSKPNSAFLENFSSFLNFCCYHTPRDHACIHKMHDFTIFGS